MSRHTQGQEVSLLPSSPWHVQLPTSKRASANTGPALVLNCHRILPAVSLLLFFTDRSSWISRRDWGSHSRQRLDR